MGTRLRKSDNVDIILWMDTFGQHYLRVPQSKDRFGAASKTRFWTWATVSAPGCAAGDLLLKLIVKTNVNWCVQRDGERPALYIWGKSSVHIEDNRPQQIRRYLLYSGRRIVIRFHVRTAVLSRRHVGSTYSLRLEWSVVVLIRFASNQRDIQQGMSIRPLRRRSTMQTLYTYSLAIFFLVPILAVAFGVLGFISLYIKLTRTEARCESVIENHQIRKGHPAQLGAGRPA